MTHRSLRAAHERPAAAHQGYNRLLVQKLNPRLTTAISWRDVKGPSRCGRAGQNLLWINTALLTDTVSGGRQGNWTPGDLFWLAAANVKLLPNSHLCKCFCFCCINMLLTLRPKSRWRLVIAKLLKTALCLWSELSNWCWAWYCGL